MSVKYFEDLRIVGASLDEGIKKLMETWTMPRLLLCKNSEEDRVAARTFLNDLRNDIKTLKESVEEDKVSIKELRETNTHFLQESINAIKSLKEEVNDLKTLFLENGYLEDPNMEISNVDSTLELLSVNINSSFTKNIQISAEPNTENIELNNDLETKESYNTPERSTYINKKLSLNDQPVEPIYSPHFYKIIKN